MTAETWDRRSAVIFASFGAVMAVVAIVLLIVDAWTGFSGRVSTPQPIA